MKALIVDDSRININVAKAMLEKIGLEVDFALSGLECLEKVKNNHYDIIFMDIMMPDMDGIQTFQNLKEIPGFSIPIIALTADEKDGAREKYLGLGFNGYISKPIDMALLKDVINELARTA